MLDLAYAAYKSKEEYDKQKRNRSSNTMMAVLPAILSLLFGIISFVIIYGNMKFVFTCKNGGVGHFICGFLFKWIYLLYRLISNC